MCFKIKNEIQGQGQSAPKSTWILTVVRYIFGSNLKILTWIGGEFLHGQAQNGVNFYYKLNLALKVKVNQPKTIGILTKVFCIFCPNLVVLVQGWHRHTLTHTDAGNNNTRRPKLASDKKWVTIILFLFQDEQEQPKMIPPWQSHLMGCWLCQNIYILLHLYCLCISLNVVAQAFKWYA